MNKKTKWPKLPRYFIPLFNSANVYLCRSRDEWAQALQVLGVEDHEAAVCKGRATNYRNTTTGENLYLIGIFDGGLNTLVHECAHVAFFTCRDVGVTVDVSEGNETYCYLLDSLFSHFAPNIDCSTP